jgi:hypothetical protein
MGVSRTDPIERRRLALMRQALGKTQKFSIGGQIKKGGFAPKPITLPTTPWKDKPDGHR